LKFWGKRRVRNVAGTGKSPERPWGKGKKRGRDLPSQISFGKTRISGNCRGGKGEGGGGVYPRTPPKKGEKKRVIRGARAGSGKEGRSVPL